MSYNPTYGGQFAGISAARKTDDSAKKDSKWIKQGGGAGSSAASAARPGGSGTDPLASDTPPTKVIVKISSLTFVGMPEVKAPDSRHFFVAAVFENDDLNEVMKHQRSRTKIVPGKFTGGSWNADFKGTQLVLPVVDPSKRLRFYVCAITTSHLEEEGKKTRDIALVGIGYSDSFFMDKCKTYHTQVMELKQVQGGDESIKPGKLELSLECCQDNHGPAVPPDTEDSVLEAFQATLDAAKAAEGH